MINEFIFISGDNVMIKPKNDNNANFFKKVKVNEKEKDNWKNRSFDAQKVLETFNLIYKEEPAKEVESDEFDSKEIKSEEVEDKINKSSLFFTKL